MMYKYLAYAGIGLLALMGAAFWGYHLGGLSGAKQVSDLRAQAATATAAAIDQAKTAQTQADAQTQAQLTAAVQAANAAVVARESSIAALNASLSKLKTQVALNANSSSAARAWSRVVIPSAILAGLCWTTDSASTSDCNGHQNSVHSHP